MADPQEHLGSHSAIAESKGQVTAKGTENEKRQWAAIMAQADQRLQLAISNVDVRVANFEQQRRTRDQSETAVKDAATALRQSLMQKALMEDTAFRLEQTLERARSRALKVRRSNTRLLKALEADPASATDREKRDVRELVSAAANYLALFAQKLNDEYSLLAQCVGIARRASIAAAMVEQSSVNAQSPVADCSTNGQPAMLLSHDHWRDSASAVQGRKALLDVADRTNAEVPILPASVAPNADARHSADLPQSVPALDDAGSSLVRSKLSSSAIRQIARAKFDQGR